MPGGARRCRTTRRGVSYEMIPIPASSPAPLPETRLTRVAGIRLPVIGGAMYPCSNPELVAAVSAAGGIGVLQPVSLTWVHGHDFREGVRLIRRLAGGAPVGMNALLEGGSRRYRARMEDWIDIALDEGVRFFVTSLGNPRWVVDRVAPLGGRVFHDVTERKWAVKGRDAGVHGLIAVNRRAGGHPGPRTAAELLDEVGDLGLPVVCAGGVSTAGGVLEALRLGYDGVQMGTRFIATPECSASAGYKRAIVEAGEDDIVWSERITGVPVAVIATPWIRRVGLRAGPLARRLLRGRRTRRGMRTLYTLRAAWALRQAARRGEGSGDDGAGAGRAIWQAGRSVAGVHDVRPVAAILADIESALAGFPSGTSEG
jgi:nitronate monooxygenase